MDQAMNFLTGARDFIVTHAIDVLLVLRNLADAYRADAVIGACLGAAFALLFCLWTLGRVRAAKRKLAHLDRQIDEMDATVQWLREMEERRMMRAANRPHETQSAMAPVK